MKLENGQQLPSLSADTVDDGTFTLPDDLEGAWSVVLFYRGHW